MSDNNEVAANEGVVGKPSQDDLNIALLSHLLGIFSGFVGALVIWLIKKDDSAFIAQEAKEALNFQITLTLGFVIASVLTVVFIGLLLFPVLVIANIVFSILGAVAASKGNAYKYPFALRLIK